MADALTITNVEIVDGTGAPGYTGDVVVRNGRIEALGERRGQLVDGAGLTLTPGFIDMHSHSDMTLVVDPRGVSKVSQGITTEVIGQCGMSAAPLFGQMVEHVGAYYERYGHHLDYRTLGEYLDRMDGHMSPNILALVGHGTLRRGIMGDTDRSADATELRRMQEAIEEAMSAGALGLATGLVYPPGRYVSTEELIALSKSMAAYHGLYFSHIRNEGDVMVEAVDEAIQIGQEAGVGVHISHHKAMGRQNWGKTEVSLGHIREAAKQGLDVWIDQYPYTASATSLSALLPGWVLVGGPQVALKRIRDPQTRRQILQEVVPKEEFFGWDRTTVSSVANPKLRHWQGVTLADLARRRDEDPGETLLNLLEAAEMDIGMIRHGMDETDVKRVMQYERTLIGTDGGAVGPDGPLATGHPHPRTYGTFPRVLGHYVLQEHVLPFETAIAKMTGLASKRLHLKGRGFIAPGMTADLVLLDRQAIKDRATYDRPHQTSAGIAGVMVNGTWVWRDDRHTGALPGRSIRYNHQV